jgi:hypothetical protein
MRFSTMSAKATGSPFLLSVMIGKRTKYDSWATSGLTSAATPNSCGHIWNHGAVLDVPNAAARHGGAVAIVVLEEIVDCKINPILSSLSN